MEVLAIIPARSGSKGLPNKNIAKIKGHTLLEIAINVALNCNFVDDVFISTDSLKYEEIAKKAGAKSNGLRKPDLSNDNAKTVDVALDLIESLEKHYDYIVLLQPTSPIREPIDIENMIYDIQNKNADAGVSVSKLNEPHPFKLKEISKDGYLEPFIEGKSSETPRQILPDVYALNGAIYIIKVSTLLKEKTFFPKKTIPYVMNININIDTEEDLIFLEAMEKSDKIKIWS